jgi:hypothetical protein
MSIALFASTPTLVNDSHKETQLSNRSSIGECTGYKKFEMTTISDVRRCIEDDDRALHHCINHIGSILATTFMYEDAMLHKHKNHNNVVM